MSLDERLRVGFAHCGEGRIDEARNVFEGIVATHPDDVVALRGLARVERASGQRAVAREHLERAVELAPDDAGARLELGVLCAEDGQRSAAIDHLARAGELQPTSAETWNNLGAVQFDARRFDDAAASYRRAIAAAPGQPIPQLNLAEALEAAGDDDGAVGALRAAVSLDPNLGLAWSTLGRTLHAAGRFAEAIGPLRRAAELQPTNATVHLLVAQTLYQLDVELDEIVVSFERALELDAQLAPAWRGLGHAQLQRKAYLRAVESLERALELEPGHAFAHFHLGQARFELGRTEAALEAIRRAVASGPRELADAAAMNLAVTIPGNPADDHAAILAARQAFGRTLPQAERPSHRPGDTGPLTVGYVSSYFHRRNWMKPVWGLINAHDRERFAIHLFSDAPRESFEAGYSQHADDRFTDISALTNEEAAATIRAAGVDVLVDLNGYSVPERLAIYTLRPAPTLIGWFNLYATTGLTCYDALIGDASVIRPDEERHYTERIVRVPGSYLTFSVDYPVPDVAPPPCASSAAFTLGCLGSAYKITDSVVATWAAMLQRAPNARLLCRNRLLRSDEHRRWFAQRFAQHGIEPQRLDLLGPCEHDAFLATYDRIDVALDVFPYNGGTTTTEALWQGVPVATFDGDRWVSRTSASLLVAGGLSEFVAKDRASHVEQVVALATDPAAPQRLAELRCEQRARLEASPVCDTAAFCRQMEAVYRSVHDERR